MNILCCWIIELRINKGKKYEFIKNLSLLPIAPYPRLCVAHKITNRASTMDMESEASIEATSRRHLRDRTMLRPVIPVSLEDIQLDKIRNLKLQRAEKKASITKLMTVIRKLITIEVVARNFDFCNRNSTRS